MRLSFALADLSTDFSLSLSNSGRNKRLNHKHSAVISLGPRPGDLTKQTARELLELNPLAPAPLAAVARDHKARKQGCLPPENSLALAPAW